MNKLRTILSLFLLPVALFAQDNLSLEEAIEFGLENNNDLKNAKVNAEIRKEYAFEIMTEGFPQINVNLDYAFAFEQQVSIIPAGVFGPTEQEFIFAQPQTANLTADVSQLVFDARYIYGLKARNALIASADYEVEQQRINTTESIIKAYYGALISQEAYSLLSQNEATLRQILNETSATYKEGLIDELSVNRLELNMSNLLTQIEKQRNQWENALLNLKYVIGMPNDSTIILDEEFITMMENFSYEVSAQADPENRIETKLLANQAALRKYDIKQARSSYFPSLYAYALYGTLAQRETFNFFDSNLRWYDFGTVGFKLKIPVFDGLKAKSQVQQRKLELQIIENNQANIKEVIDLQVSNSQNNMANAISEYNNQVENLALADKILNKTIIMFNEGVGSSFELSQAQQEYTNTMINYTQSLYNLLIAKLDVNKALGSL
ncbi:MAG: outer membrane protein [Chitinophagales bacterium]|jgi:outer membrane protein